MAIISVIIPTYNHSKFIAQALDSVLCQKDCPEFEILIGNDCSSDNTKDIIEEYERRYPKIIKTFTHSENMGLTKNLKLLFSKASGEYIAMLEGDDWWCDTYRLAKMYSELQKNMNASLCFSNLKKYIQEEKIYKEHINAELAAKIGKNITIASFIELGNPIINFSCVMYRKKYVDLIPDEYYQGQNADFLFNAYMLDMSYGIYIDEVMSIYRVHNNSLWSKLSNAEKSAKIINAFWKLNNVFKNKYFTSCAKILKCHCESYLVQNNGVDNKNISNIKTKRIIKLQVPISKKQKLCLEVTKVKELQ